MVNEVLCGGVSRETHPDFVVRMFHVKRTAGAVPVFHVKQASDPLTIRHQKSRYAHQ
jgi:hypothetical protein